MLYHWLLPVALSENLPETDKLGLKCSQKAKEEKNISGIPLRPGVTRSGVTYLESEQPWVPRLAWGRPEKVWEEVPAVEPALGLQCLAPWGMNPKLRMQARPPGAEPNPVHPKNPANMGLERVSQVDCSLVVGFSPAASSDSFPCFLTRASTFSISLRQGFEFVWG